MTFAGDERGQPVVIGALLIFTILILAFAGYQAFAVPQQNAEVEFNHFQDVQSDFAELESNLINAVESGDTRSASIDLGPQYPSRMIALNPPPAAGSLGSTESGNVTISGTSKSICREGGTPYTRSLVYQPSYAEFDNAESIVYENRVTGRQFREGNVFGEQRLVASNSDRINLLLLTGEVSDNGVGQSNVEISATGRYSTTVTNPTITLPSRFSATEWQNQILTGRDDIGVSPAGPNRVELDFPNRPFTVSCAVAGLNSEPAFSPPQISTPNPPQNNSTKPSSPPQVESASLERNQVERVFLDDYSQYEFTYNVSSVNGTLEKVGLQLQDSNNNVYTATTQTVTDSESYEGKWVTPRFRDIDLGFPNEYSVRIEVFTDDGVTTLRTVQEGEPISDSDPSYSINDVRLRGGGGNSIDVTTDITTSDSGASLLIRSLRRNGDIRDEREITGDVSGQNTYSIQGANQANRVEVILRDSSEDVQDSRIEDWPP